MQNKLQIKQESKKYCIALKNLTSRPQATGRARDFREAKVGKGLEAAGGSGAA